MDNDKPIDTCIYGSVLEKSKCLDIYEILKDKIYNYKLSKIKCQIKSNKGLYGIQFFYRNLIDGKESPLINIQPKEKEKDLIEQEFDLNGDSIIDLKTWLDDNYKLTGFEVITNRNRTQKFGYGNNEPIQGIIDFKNLDKIIIGFGVYINEDDNFITALYGYYLNRSKFLMIMYKGILYLRKKSQNPNFVEKIKKKLPSMNKKNQILFKICNLPQNQFFNIIKYTQ